MEKPKVTAGLVFKDVWEGLSLRLDCLHHYLQSLWIIDVQFGLTVRTQGEQWFGLVCGVENPGPIQRISAAECHPLNSGVFPLHRAVWLDIARAAIGPSVAIVMGLGACCLTDPSLDCIEKQRMEEDEDPT